MDVWRAVGGIGEGGGNGKGRYGQLNPNPATNHPLCLSEQRPSRFPMRGTDAHHVSGIGSLSDPSIPCIIYK